MNTRPLLHFTAEFGWINDPHGLTFHNGEYHLFYQYVPGADVWAPGCHWGHAVSTNLFDWQERPVALAPGDGDDGIWTGCLVNDPAGARIFYTSTVLPELGHGRIRVATPADDTWDEWVKGEIVIDFPDLDGLHSFRDPVVFRDGDLWRMTVGAGFEGGVAAALAYSSPDLHSWTYDGIMSQRSTTETDGVWTGSMWECPQLFDAAGRTSMVLSVWEDNNLYYTATATGDRVGSQLTDLTWSQLSFGTSMYAPSVFTDSAGRTCLVFWLRDVADTEAGWAGAHSVPYELGVEGGRVIAVPHRDLYSRHREWTGSAVAWDADWRPLGAGSLSVIAEGATLAEIAVSADQVVVTSGDTVVSLPFVGGAVRVIADARVVEVETDGRVAAVVLPAAASPSYPVVTSGVFDISELG